MGNRPTKIKINVMLIDKSALFNAKSGAKYLDAVAWPNKDGEDTYGMTHYIVQEVSKEARDRGEKGKIIGNMKIEIPGEPAPRAQDDRRAQGNQRSDKDRLNKPGTGVDDSGEDEIPF